MAKVWNATKSTLKVGQARVLLAAGTSIDVEIDEIVTQHIAAGRLVVIGESAAPAAAPVVEEEEVVQAKKQAKKKPAEPEQEPQIEAEAELVVEELPQSKEELTEDSILPEDNQ